MSIKFNESVEIFLNTLKFKVHSIDELEDVDPYIIISLILNECKIESRDQ